MSIIVLLRRRLRFLAALEQGDQDIQSGVVKFRHSHMRR